jgi:AraC-like DNA-binding protein
LNVFYSLLLTVFQAQFSNRFVIELIENFPFSFLSGPFVFFYCREEILQRPQFGLRDLFHFLPLVIYLFYGFASNIEIKDFTIIIKSNIEIFTIASDSFLFLIRIVQIFIYFSLGLLLCFNRFGLSTVPESRISMFAPFFILYLTLIFLSLYPHSYFIILSYFDLQYNFFISLLIVFTTGIVIRLFMWRYPVIVEAVNVTLQSKYQEQVIQSKEVSLSQQQAELFTNLIDDYLRTKPFRQNGFNKYHLISSLGLPEYLVNSYFNQYLGVSFSSWKTFQRIQESTELIRSGFLQAKTIEYLAKEVGFSSRSRFVEAFRKQMECSPTEYHLKFFPNA